MFATEYSLGVHMAKSYKFVIITSPVGAYYPEGIDPVKILVGMNMSVRYRAEPDLQNAAATTPAPLPDR